MLYEDLCFSRRNFSPSSKPSVSFRALLEEEKRLGKNISSSKNQTVKQNLFMSVERCQSTRYVCWVASIVNLLMFFYIQSVSLVNVRAWQHSNVACSPPDHSYMEFDKIQELQEEETATRER